MEKSARPTRNSTAEKIEDRHHVEQLKFGLKCLSRGTCGFPALKRSVRILSSPSPPLSPAHALHAWLSFLFTGKSARFPFLPLLREPLPRFDRIMTRLRQAGLPFYGNIYGNGVSSRRSIRCVFHDHLSFVCIKVTSGMASESAASVPFTVLMYHVNRRFLESETRSKGTAGFSIMRTVRPDSSRSGAESYLPSRVIFPPLFRIRLFYDNFCFCPKINEGSTAIDKKYPELGRGLGSSDTACISSLSFSLGPLHYRTSITTFTTPEGLTRQFY